MQEWTGLLHHWLYDWNGANREIFLAVNAALPSGWVWVAEALSAGGSYWASPAALLVLLAASRRSPAAGARRVRDAAVVFVAGLVLALVLGAIAKHGFAYPRPSDVFGPSVYRSLLAPDSRYTLPSGHATYVGVLAAAAWPLLGRRDKAALLLFAGAVGWSRIALGAHFPADVLAGYALGWTSAVAVRPLARRARARAGAAS